MRAPRSSGREHGKENTRKTARTATPQKKPGPSRVPGGLYCPQVRGKVVEAVHVDAGADGNWVILSFTDKTELVLDFEPRLALTADYSDWKTGNQRIIKRWPARNSASSMPPLRKPA
ncbi:MAG TPA: hypothetical protein VF532_00240 [Candidatus Angelobacter sp.]